MNSLLALDQTYDLMTGRNLMKSRAYLAELFHQQFLYTLSFPSIHDATSPKC